MHRLRRAKLKIYLLRAILATFFTGCFVLLSAGAAGLLFISSTGEMNLTGTLVFSLSAAGTTLDAATASVGDAVPSITCWSVNFLRDLVSTADTNLSFPVFVTRRKMSWFSSTATS